MSSNRLMGHQYKLKAAMYKATIKDEKLIKIINLKNGNIYLDRVLFNKLIDRAKLLES